MPFASTLSSPQQNQRRTEGFAREIQSLTGVSVTIGEAGVLPPPGGSLPVVLALTGGIEGSVLRALNEREAMGDARGPVVILAHEEANSLPASLEILARLHQLGRTGLILRHRDWAARLPVLARLWGAAAQLQGLRLGVVGEPSDWLVASPVSPGALRSVWGTEAVDVPMGELISGYDTARAGEAEAAAVRAGASGVREPGEKEYGESARVYLALRDVMEKHRLGGVALRCFDLVTDRGATGCYALSRLNDEGVVGACEGDVPSAISMALLSAISGRPAFMANPADIDPDTNSLLFAHWTIARSLTTSFALRSHFESGLGVAIQGDLPEGPVTVMRAGGQNLDQVMVASGELTGGSKEEGLCRTQIRVQLKDYDVGRLLTEPLGNHHVIALGDHSEEVREYLRLFAPQVQVQR